MDLMEGDVDGVYLQDVTDAEKKLALKQDQENIDLSVSNKHHWKIVNINVLN